MKSNYLATGGIFSNAQNHRQSTQKGESSATSTLQNIFIYSKAKESELFFLRKSCLVIILLILSVLITSGQTTFTLTAPARTSAGIYKTDGTLIRTLWNNVQKNAGTYQIKWDGTNDDSATVPAGNYNVKVLTNNVNYRWEGVIGNTSASFTGPDIHKGYLRMYSMCIAGNTAYYSNYYNEGHSSQFKISLDNPQSRTEILSYGQSSLYSATDGKTVYWAGDDVLGGHNNWFVFGTQVSDDKEESFSSGQSYAV